MFRYFALKGIFCISGTKHFSNNFHSTVEDNNTSIFFSPHKLKTTILNENCQGAELWKLIENLTSF